MKRDDKQQRAPFLGLPIFEFFFGGMIIIAIMMSLIASVVRPMIRYFFG